MLFCAMQTINGATNGVAGSENNPLLEPISRKRLPQIRSLRASF
jgi:hypothetical protein